MAVELAQAPQLARPGGSVKIRVSELPVPLIIARTAAETYVVAAIECPHRRVEVEYQPESGEFECASLGSSQFAADGSLLHEFAIERRSQRPRCFSDHFLVRAAKASAISTSRRFHAVKLDSAELFNFPLVIMTGAGSELFHGKK